MFYFIVSLWSNRQQSSMNITTIVALSIPCIMVILSEMVMIGEDIGLKHSESIKGSTIPPIGISYHNIPPREEHLPLLVYHTLRIIYIQQGRGIWSIGSKHYPISPGDIFMLNNSEYRAIRTVFPPDYLKLTVIDFEPRLIWPNDQNAIMVSNELRLFLDRRSLVFENRASGETAISSKVKTIIEEMEEELSSMLPEYDQMLKVKLLNILVLLNRHYSEFATEQSGVHLSHEQLSLISRVLQYIDEHLDEDMTRQHIADCFHIHPSTLSKLFKKWNGISLSQYMIKKKIYSSVQLLSHSQLSVLDIATRCGFNNTANFYKAFKRVTGGIPSDFRSH